MRLSFCRVAEFQRRGIVHLHAVIRADGPDTDQLPITAEQLADACLKGARAIKVSHSRGVATWGAEVDAQGLDPREVERNEIAGYVSKYATKSSDGSDSLDRRITSEADLARRGLSPHVRRMAETAWRLGADPELDHLHLRRHTHTLGYGGHFLTKSLLYSTTFRSLRAARSEWRERRRHGDVAPCDQAVEADWQLMGIAWSNVGEALFAEDKWQQRVDEIKAANEDRYWV